MFKTIWKQMRSDWVRILMAFVLGSMIYLLRSDVFSSAIESKEISNIPVHLEYSSANIVNLDNKITTASITVEGSVHRIRKLSAKQISVTVQVNQSHLETGMIELTEKNIKTPLGVRVKDIHTRRIIVNLELLESKKVKVTPVFDSVKNLSENYSISKTAIFPNEVVISGPKSKIKDVKEVFTSPIPLDSSIQDNFKYTANIATPEGVASAPTKVKCDISISQNFSKRTIKKVPIQLLSRNHTALKFTLNPVEVDIEISGPSRIVHFLSADNFDVFVNTNNIKKPGEYILNIRCASRSNEIKIISVTPIQLTLSAR